MSEGRRLSLCLQKKKVQRRFGGGKFSFIRVRGPWADTSTSRLAIIVAWRASSMSYVGCCHIITWRVSLSRVFPSRSSMPHTSCRACTPLNNKQFCSHTWHSGPLPYPIGSRASTHTLPCMDPNPSSPMSQCRKTIEINNKELASRRTVGHDA